MRQQHREAPFTSGALRPEDSADFTVPLDQHGLVLYFGVRGQRFVYNGNTGFFSDTLPPVATEAFAALAVAGPERQARFERLRQRYGAEAEPFLHEIDLLQRGTHPDLSPEPRQTAFAHPMAPHTFTVYLAQACNLACRYCFNSGGSFGGRRSLMSVETAREVLAFITRLVRTERHPVVTVNLFGGEPLLAPEATRLLARGLQDLNHEGLRTQVHILLFTNGTLYCADIFSILAERPDLCTVMVSLDGFRDAHDANRQFVEAGRGSSYDVVVANLRRMVAAKVPASVVCVVPHPFDFIGASEALHALPVPSLEIKDPHYHVYGRDTLPEVLRRDVALWREQYLAYTDYYLDYLAQPGAIRHVDRLALLRDTAALVGNPRAEGISLACRLADLKVGITPDGGIMPCVAFLRHEQYGLGDVRRGFDPERYARFRDWLLREGQHRVDRESCRHCVARFLCGGGCYSESLDKHGRLEPAGEPTCSFAQEKLKIDLYYLSQVHRRFPRLFTAATGIAA